MSSCKRQRLADDIFLRELEELSPLLPLHDAPPLHIGFGEGWAEGSLDVMHAGPRIGDPFAAHDFAAEGCAAWPRPSLMHPDALGSHAAGDSPVFEGMGSPMHESTPERSAKRKWGGDITGKPPSAEGAGTMEQCVAGRRQELLEALGAIDDEEAGVAACTDDHSGTGSEPSKGFGHAITVRFGGLAHSLPLGAQASARDLATDVLGKFELPPASRLVLRCETGRVVPLSARLRPGGTYTIDAATSASGAACLAAPCSARAAADAAWRRPSPLQFLQEPPHGDCQWLSVKMTRSNEPRPAMHLVSPAMKVALPLASLGAVGRGAAEAAMAGARVRLWTPDMQDVSHFLHAGRVQVRVDGGRVEACWPELAFAAISAHARVHGVKESTAISDDTGRAARGWFHLSVELAGLPVPPLYLTSRGAPARIVVKHTRLAGRLTGRWAERQLGPYADHSRCRPAHIDPSGVRLCRCGSARRVHAGCVGVPASS